MNVLICDPISPRGIEYFKQQAGLNVTVLDKRLPEAELLPLVAETDAMVVRSETKITRAVIDKSCDSPDGTIIGEDPLEDARRFHVSEGGVVLVTPGMLGQEWHHVR